MEGNNMAGNKKISIPRNLAACISDSNHECRALMAWGDRIKKWGNIIVAFIIVVGLIVSIAGSFTQTYDVDYWGDIETETHFNVWTFLLAMIQWGLYAFLAYAVVQAFSFIADSLMEIAKNSKISIDLALYQAGRANGSDKDVYLEDNREAEKEPIRQESIPITTPPQEKQSSVPAKAYEDSAGEVTCPVCGKQQNANGEYCIYCGQKLIQSDAHVPY